MELHKFLKLHPNDKNEMLISLDKVLYVRRAKDELSAEVTVDGENWYRTDVSFKAFVLSVIDESKDVPPTKFISNRV